ncbi:30S ribosomal protein S6e [Vulcanisaeta distributa]|uniref:Small ribosomal subunit protein eS6 n=1 Tax=Vulcanisaeta distributa (strain DSM 14429 / JCM 11212 / NBRC 100878 / IC-017) TaxID=572478 RepID=E1QNN6_VULDI|nr:30S ribosomal protein S6e [Vulcanisaeta distributa]ADN51324.1 Ribosomal protein S6e [Vulcanisaeta distributa DSM 14429]
MPTFKLVLSDPMSGRAKQFEVKDPIAQRFVGLRIGDEIDGGVIKEVFELPPGFKIRITGGSGVDGAPMLPNIEGAVKKYLLMSEGVGYHPEKRGMRKRKLVRGNTISDQIVQVNAVLVYPKDWKEGPIIPLGDKEVQKLGGGAEQKAEEKQ